ncbi:MAG: DinB family protein [Acidobacteriaceae bacterium]|nr:DinB family protein [Acidobacteriaceae bacterium]
MKLVTFPAIIAALGFASAAGAPMSNMEREHLIAHMQMTEGWLIDEVSNLSPSQLNFRMATGRWTILEVVEHLVIAEPIYWQQFQAALKQPPRKLEKRPTDADVLWYGIDRVHHEKTEPSKEPKGQLSDVHQGLESFRKLHATMLDYVRTTDDDLRGHAMPEWGTDTYQCLLEISTHDQRHILQIREIKADPAFPKQ